MRLRPNTHNSRQLKLKGKKVISQQTKQRLIRKKKATIKKICFPCQADDGLKTRYKIYPKLVLRRCQVGAEIKLLNLNPRIHLRRCDDNVKRNLLCKTKKHSSNTKLRPTLSLHRCKVVEVLDRCIVEASKFEMFMVELYPMLIRTWVNPRDFTPQKCMFDEFKKRNPIPGKILSFPSAIVWPCRIVARRTLSNGQIEVLWS